MATREIFLKQVKKKLDAWKMDVDRLQANPDHIGSQDMGRYTAVIQEIIAMIQQTEKQFTDRSRLSADTWQTLKQQIENRGRQIEARIQQAKKEFSL